MEETKPNPDGQFASNTPPVYNIARARPAETGSILAGALVGLLVGYGVISTELAPHWLVLISATPAIITSVVELFTKR